MTYNIDTQAAIDSLDAFRSFLVGNADRLAHVKFDIDFGIVSVNADELAALASCPGGWTKAGTDAHFALNRMFGDVEFSAWTSREEVCEARPTGRKIKKVVQVAAPKYEEQEVDEVEWVCSPLLAVQEAT